MSNKLIKSKPIRMWIDGKCFNINKYMSVKKNKLNKSQEANAKVQNEIDNTKNKIATNNVDGLNILDQCSLCITHQNDSGQISTSFKLPRSYYTRLTSFYKSDVEAVQNKTSTEILVPKHESVEELTIRGDTTEKIIEASTDILSVIGNIREHNQPIQFISIPCLSEEVQQNFEKFKNEILNGEPIEGMHESIFQKTAKLHLTINVFVLLDENEVSEAIKALEEYNSSILSPLIEKTGPITIHLYGIDCMNTNYKKVDVLYAQAQVVDETDEKNLQNIADGIQEYFYDRGLVKNYKEGVKLHVTLINTKYRKEPDSPKKTPKKRWPKRRSFDATTIMEKYRDFDFGKCSLDSIHLSLISSHGEDGFYKPLSIVKLK